MPKKAVIWLITPTMKYKIQAVLTRKIAQKTVGISLLRPNNSQQIIKIVPSISGKVSL